MPVVPQWVRDAESLQPFTCSGTRPAVRGRHYVILTVGFLAVVGGIVAGAYAWHVRLTAERKEAVLQLLISEAEQRADAAHQQSTQATTRVLATEQTKRDLVAKNAESQAALSQVHYELDQAYRERAHLSEALKQSNADLQASLNDLARIKATAADEINAAQQRVQALETANTESRRAIEQVEQRAQSMRDAYWDDQAKQFQAHIDARDETIRSLQVNLAQLQKIAQRPAQVFVLPPPVIHGQHNRQTPTDPPAPRVETIPPKPDATAVWSPGRWVWNHTGWNWVSGTWRHQGRGR